MAKRSKPVSRVIFRPKITLKNGRVLYAWMYGLKAFPINLQSAASPIKR